VANRVIEYIVKAKDQSKGVLDKVAKQLGINSSKYLAMGAAAVAAAVLVVGAVKKMISKMSEFVNEMAGVGDEFDKMSARTSISVEKLGEWVFLMERAGGNASSFEGAIRRLTKSMVDHQRGLSTAVDAWASVGVSVSDAEGNLRSVDDVLLDLADALSKMDNQTERLGVSQDILGRGAAQMVVLLAQGRPELEKQLDLYKSINGEVREEFTSGAAAIVDAQTDLATAIRGIKSDLAEPFQTEIAEVIDEVAISIGTLGQFMEDNKADAKEFAEDLATMAIGFVDLSAAVVRFTVEHGPEMLKLIEAADPILSAFNKTLGVFGDLTKDTEDGAKRAGIAVDFMAEGFRNANAVPTEGRRAKADAIEAERKAVVDLTAALRDMIEPNAALKALGTLKVLDAAQDDEDSPVTKAERLAIANRENEEAIQASLMGLNEMFDPGLSGDAIDALEEYKEQMELIDQTATNLVENLQGMLSSSIFKVMSGEAVEFGRVIREVVLKALAEMIAKMIIIAGLNFITGGAASAAGAGASSGGGFSSGGGAGPTTLGLPLFDKSSATGDMSKSFLNGSAISPFELGAGSDKELHLHMDIGRPVGRLDALSLGQDFVAAAEFAKDGEL